ncbi:MAG TPA: excalibur calcium-binding domain-containing protein [Micromonosporaceae bacterium]|jgi:hypothetical protein|nr:excalibur calcium-binding domain-containing protein [Micromonosporaceae bacterium]
MAGHFIFIGTAVLAGSMLAVASPQSATHYKNCTAMHAAYPHGVGKAFAVDHVASKKIKRVTNFHIDSALYKANKALDTDHDGVACEAP